MVTRFENLVTQTHKDKYGNEISFQVNTTLLLSIYYTPGSRTNKDIRKEKVAHRLFKEKHPWLSKVYNPYEINGYRESRWYKPTVVFNYGKESSWVSFPNNEDAAAFHAEMSKKYFGK